MKTDEKTWSSFCFIWCFIFSDTVQLGVLAITTTTTTLAEGEPTLFLAQNTKKLTLKEISTISHKYKRFKKKSFLTVNCSWNVCHVTLFLVLIKCTAICVQKGGWSGELTMGGGQGTSEHSYFFYSIHLFMLLSCGPILHIQSCLFGEWLYIYIYIG